MEAQAYPMASGRVGSSADRPPRPAEAAPRLIWAARDDGALEFVNRHFLEYAGLPADRLPGRRWPELVHPDDRDRCRICWEEGVRGGREFELEFRIRGRDGIDRWFLGRAEPAVDDEGCCRWIGTATDIHDRAEAPRSSWGRDRSTRRVLDHLFAFTGVLDPDGTLLDANEAPLRAAGVGLDEVRGRKFWDCGWWTHSGEVSGRIREACRRAASGEPVRFDVEFLRADGSLMALDFQVAPLRDDSGRVTHLVPSAVDITDRVRLEGERRRLAELVEHSPDFIALAGLDGRLTYLNAGGRRMIGLDPDADPGGLLLGDPIGPGRPGRPRDDILPAVLELGRWDGEARIRHLGTGDPIDLSRSTFLIRDPRTGAPLGLGTVSRDVTEANRARDELREKHKFISDFTALLPSVLYLYDLPTRRSIYLNHQAGGSLGYGEAELSGRPAGLLDLEVHPEDAPRFERHLQRLATLPEGQTAAVEYRLRHRDGSWRWFRSLDSAFRREADGRVREVIGLANDITDRKRAEQALQAGEEQLRLAVEVARLGVLAIDYEADEAIPDATAAEMFGLAPGTPVPRQAVHDRFHPDDLEELGREIRRALDPAGEGRLAMEHRVVLPDGSTRWLSVRKRIAFASDGGRPRPTCGVLAAVDITERKRAEQALRESEARFRGMFDRAAVGIAQVDLLGRWLRVNDALCEITGHPRPELLRQAFHDLTHPDDLGADRAHLSRLLAGDCPSYTIEKRLIREGGEVAWVELTASLVRDDSGEPDHLIAVVHDITARKRAESAFREGERRFRTLAEAGPSITVMLDARGRPGYANSRWEQYFGLSIEEAGRRAWVGTIHPDDYDLAVARWQDCVGRGETFEIEGRLRRRDGQMRWHLSRFVPLRDESGAVAAWCGTITDFHEVKAAEQALRESERRFRSVADSAPAMLWMTEPDGSCSFLSRGWSAYTGQSEAQGRGFGWLDAAHPDDRDRIARVFRDALGRREACQLDYRLRTAIGTYRWVTDLAQPRTHDDGRFLGYIGSVIDISERKEAEQQAAEARELAESANRAKSEFLANMSHEIRTPMTAILGYADILARRVTDPDDLQCVETIRRNGHHLIGLINDILDLSKVEAGRLEMDPRRFEPDRLVAEVRSLMDIRAREKGLRLEVEFDGPMPETVESDPTRLRQVLVNLVGNAIKFTESGSVRVVVGLDRRPGPPRLRFEVIDTGIGIPPEQAGRLFRPFSQGDSSMTRLYGGTGLGLAICRRLVELLGGSISVESSPGSGSRFAFTAAVGPLDGVPMVQPRTAEDVPDDAGPDEEEDLPRRLDCLVLVVDDRPEIRYIARMYLEEAGARVETAEDGEAAIAAVRRLESAGSPADVVVMDMQMPRLDGYSAVASLRTGGFSRPVIALTASAMRGDRERCLRAGCTEYLPKPIDRRMLIDLVGRLARESAPPAPEPPPPAGGLRVLVVDDSPDICRVTARLLAFSGHQARTAGDGRATLELAAEFLPEVLLLDLGLPDIDGLELVALLRQIDGLAGSTYIAVTGRDRREDRERALAAGFDHHMVKPVDIDDILALFPGAGAPPPAEPRGPARAARSPDRLPSGIIGLDTSGTGPPASGARQRPCIGHVDIRASVAGPEGGGI